MDRNLMMITTAGVVAILAIAAVAIVLTSDNNGGFDHGNKVVDPKISASEINLTAEDLGEGWELVEPMVYRVRSSDFNNSINEFVNESGNVVDISVLLMGSQKIANLHYSLSAETDFVQSDMTFLSKCQNSLMVSKTGITQTYDEELNDLVYVENSYMEIYFQDLDAVVNIVFDIDPSDPLIEKIMSTIEKKIHENATDPPNFNHRQKYVMYEANLLNLTLTDLGGDWAQDDDEGYYGDYGNYTSERSFNNMSNESILVKMTNLYNVSYALDILTELKGYDLEGSEMIELSKCQDSFKVLGENDITYYFQDLGVLVEIVIVSDDADALATQIMSILEKRIHDASQFTLMNVEVS